MQEQLTISMLQCSLEWENKAVNMSRMKKRLKRLKGKTDVVVLPEMFTTGFTMSASRLAETVDGPTCSGIKSLAAEHDFAIAGSFIAEDAGRYYNRAFFITPLGECHFYDKRHLFRMAGEDSCFSAGEERHAFTYKGWNICLQVCYDLRFPVWSRNEECRYDLLIFVANWPEARIRAWNVLLPARAVENICYVCGVNRTGMDGKGILYSGSSQLVGPKGNLLVNAGKRQDVAYTYTLKKEELIRLRKKFPVWKDADSFVIVGNNN